MSVPELPRVTSILASVGLAPDYAAIAPETLQAAAERGSKVHALIEATHYGFAEPEDVTPDVAPYLAAYEKFVVDSGYQPIATEIEVRHPDYVGHVDQIGWLLGRRLLVDFKTTSAIYPSAAYQVAGYRMAWQHQHPKEPITALAVVQLRGDGTYRLHEVAIAQAERVWLAALTVYLARQRRTLP